jgi:hypothetical protein
VCGRVELIRADRKIIIDSLATALGCSHGLAYSCSMMDDGLKSGKVVARWVLKELKNWEEINRIGLSLQHLLRYADEVEVNRIVAGEESWVHHYQLESKRSPVQWKHPSSPSCSTKNCKHTGTASAGKVLLTVLGILRCGENVNSVCYCEVMVKFRDIIRRKRFRSTGRRCTASSWQCQTPRNPSNRGKNSRTTVGTSWTSALQPGLSP